MKKLLALLLALVMVLGLVACAAPAEKPAEAPADKTEAPAEETKEPAEEVEEPAVEEEKIKLRLVSISTDAVQEAILENYIKKNIGEVLPNVEVEFEPGGGGEDMSNKMKTYNSTGDLPDVWYSTADYAFPIIAAGNQLDLAEYINNDGFINNYNVPSALEFREGKIYALASGADTYFVPRIFYNKAIFEENGVEIPTTWDELVAAVETFKAADIVPISLMGKGGWAPQLYLVQTMTMLHDPAAAEAILNNAPDCWSDPAVLEGLKKIEELAKMGAFPDGVANLDYGPSLEMFTSGRSAMFWGMGWEAPALGADENVGLMQWPQMSENVDPSTVTQLWGSPLNGYAVNPNSEHLEEAIKLAEFCVSMEAQYHADQGSSTNLNPENPAQNPSDFMKEYLAMYDAADVKLNAIMLNAMDGKTSAEYGLLGANLLTGSYTAEQFVEDFSAVWAENEFFN